MSERVSALDESINDPQPTLPDEGRRALVVLLSNRVLMRSRNATAWKGLVDHEPEITERLADLFLSLAIDHDRGVAFKRQMDVEGAPRLLRRETKELSRDASLLLLHLTQQCAYSDPATEPTVTSEQIGEFLRTFRGDHDNDEQRFERRVHAAINALAKPWNLLIPDPAAEGTFTISAVVPMLLGVDEVLRLEGIYRDAMRHADVDAGYERVTS